MTVADSSLSLADGDFVELSYTARLADGGRVIDTTDPEVAEDADIADITGTGPCVVILGKEHLFDPVEEEIKETGVGDSGRASVDPSDAFGELDPTAKDVIDIEHIPTEQRRSGARVGYKGQSGFVDSIDDESATVNFNHPLAGTRIEYEFTVHQRVTETDGQIDGLLSLYGIAETIDARLESEGADQVLWLKLTAPDQSVDNWEARKLQLVTDLRNALSIDEIRIMERYPSP